MATGQRVEPYGNYRFHVEIGGVTYGIFRECSGFTSEITVTENSQGGALITQKMPGRVKIGNIILKWGLTDSDELYRWHQEWVNGSKYERKNGSIVVLNQNGEEKVRWNFFDGWPCKWDGPDFNASSNDVAIETLEIAIERIERG